MIVGSLREKSLNRQLAKRAEELLVDRAQVSYLEYGSLPYMNQDIEYPAPAEVERIRSQVKEADGLWIVTPEYNYSYPGGLKNLLDWLSRPLKPLDFEGETSLRGKKAIVSGVAGKSGASGARQKLLELLGVLGVSCPEKLQGGYSVGYEAFATDVLELSAEDEAALRGQAEGFLEFLETTT